MAIVQISRIQHRRGLQENLPQLSHAELGWVTDDRSLYIGNGPLSAGAPVVGNTQILTEYSDLAGLINLVENGKISNTIATSKIFPSMMDSNLSAEEIAINNNWIQESDSSALDTFIDEVIERYPEKVEQYRNGKKGLIGLFMGEIMKLSKGKADPKLCNQILKEKLDN